MKVGFFAWAAGKMEEAYVQHRLQILEDSLNCEELFWEPGMPRFWRLSDQALQVIMSEDKAIGLLIGHLRSDKPEQRKKALSALISAGEKGRILSVACMDIAKRLEDEDAMIRGMAARAVTVLSDNHGVYWALPRLLDMVMDHSIQDTVISALKACSLRKADISPALSMLEAGLGSSDHDKRLKAALGFHEAIKQGIDVSDHLEAIANAYCDDINRGYPMTSLALFSSVHAFMESGPRPLAFFVCHARGMDDEDPVIRHMAAEGLGKARSAASLRISVPALMGGLGNKDLSLARRSLEALLSIDSGLQREDLGSKRKILNEAIEHNRVRFGNECAERTRKMAAEYYCKASAEQNRNRTRMLSGMDALSQGTLKPPRGTRKDGMFRSVVNEQSAGAHPKRVAV